MQDKPALRGGIYDILFFLWNMFLSISSCLGAILLFPSMYDEFINDENYGICAEKHKNNTIAVHVIILFSFSKSMLA